MAHSTKTSAEKRRRQSDLVIVPYEEGRFDPSSTVAKYSSQHGKKPEPMVAEDGPTGSQQEAQKETRGHGFDDCVEHKGNNKGGYVTYETENVFHKVNASFQ
ncbi:hypothetical protein LTR99_009805 [Exophiala xenobiotica]|nr:hypothetical protein LTR96_010649 [Exophiala xenobiotica]KAK5293359.1 hypothetical protein LTR99_009805 [Exophiala xenobiotica]KAK5551371.1 hypothetical protein LTR46_010572 [Exophiala xenobiotica]